jgi:hypothetical protein
MRATGHHVVILRDDNGRIVHTHQVIDFDEVAPLSEAELFEVALTAAARAIGKDHGELHPEISSKEELERLRAEQVQSSPARG